MQSAFCSWAVGVIFCVGLGSGASLGQTRAADLDLAAALRVLGNRNVRVHDPSPIVKCDGEYWIFFTGRGVPSICSRDLAHWSAGPVTLDRAPGWVTECVPENRGMDFWAPDAIKVNGRYLLFISASTFGENTSAIGVETNATLNPADAKYHWTDGGLVVKSGEMDDFNCIDPSSFLDEDGKLWLAFGSFWSGIKLIELDPLTGLRIAADSPMYDLAHWDAIEGSYLYHHGKYYYLFASFGMCCRGVFSTYHTRVGRSEKVTGPYVDENGVDMLLGGGTPFAVKQGPMIGPGQPGIFEEAGKFWFSCHFYDATSRGASRLSIRPMEWSAAGWPVLGKVGG